MIRRIAAAACLATVAGLLAAGLDHVAADEIRFSDGSSQQVEEIMEESFDVIRAKVGGSPQVYQTERVTEIIRDAYPSTYESGQRAEKRGDFASAVTEYRKAATSGPAWSKQYALFRMAECCRLAGALDDARTAYNSLLSESPKTRFYAPAKLGLGICDLGARRYSEARKAFETLDAEVNQKKLGEQWRYEAQLYLARALEAEGKAGDAKERYARLARDAMRKSPGVAYSARVRELAIIGRDNPDRAVKDLLETAEKSDCPVEARAGAYNALGDCYTKMGQPKQALFAYLHVVTDRELERVLTELPKALHGAALAFEKTKGLEWKERADGLRRELKDRFPGWKPE